MKIFLLKIVSEVYSEKQVVAVYWLEKMHTKEAKYIEHCMFVKDKNV